MRQIAILFYTLLTTLKEYINEVQAIFFSLITYLIIIELHSQFSLDKFQSHQLLPFIMSLEFLKHALP